MNPEDRIRMLLSLSEAEHEEAQAKYLRRLQEPFVYRGRPGPRMSAEEIAEYDRIQEDLAKPIVYKMPYGATQADGPPLPYDLRGM